MTIAYTITSGEIKVKDSIYVVPFALVFQNNGVYFLETFVSNEFYELYENKSFYTLIGKTEKGYDIEITKLSFKKFAYATQKIEFTCYGHIRLIDNRKSVYDKPKSDEIEDIIYVVEFEGLKMKFANHTTIEKYRMGSKVSPIADYDFDHTSCAMIINHPDFLANYYHLIFTSAKNGNVIIDFTKHEGYNKLLFKDYLKIKHNLICFLAFINGGHVAIKKEYTGAYITSSGNEYINAQTVYIYSRKEKDNSNLDYFIPINENHSFSSQILPHMFIHCFDIYSRLNVNLDFNALVFSLNNATQTVGLKEKYFILITALEKICSNYSKTLREPKQSIIDNTIFQEVIKPQLLQVLNDNEMQIKKESPIAWSIFKSKIGNINKSNKAETSQKLYELFAYSKIPINSEVTSLVEKERNLAVHEGVIGSTEEENIKNYWKLDHILRDIILNLIEYKGYKNYTYKYYEGV